MPRARKSPSPSPSSVPEADLDAAERALEQAVKDPGLISGIYNYCDRWCERCAFTARCLTFKMMASRGTKRGSDGKQPSALENEAFWKEIATSIALASRLARRAAKQHGIDLDAPGVRAEAAAEERRHRRQAARQGSALHRAATDYWKSARVVLDRLSPELGAVEEALSTEARMGSGDPQATAAEIRDALEVVEWYLFFIDVKLQRAVASRVDEAGGDDEVVQAEGDGSAKVALIAIDRSLGAWARLRQHLDGNADAILDLLVDLERLRRAAEREFPNARAFKRPGLDD